MTKELVLVCDNKYYFCLFAKDHGVCGEVVIQSFGRILTLFCWCWRWRPFSIKTNKFARRQTEQNV